ncbi:type II secretion system GspH family protein [Rossellomorea sp. SC111]|uniref:type II secretion system GspH family protein n=1 Tax=Rossellomorea sp. SC111 TaxID=2968985 RepID=UPI00215ADA7C|nr:type II secretion system GspH family protein [Rossellomorea sp. SC111]MCR8850138.1 type II secretion system GspH family protein [Rossellomorea sp. SC111]
MKYIKIVKNDRGFTLIELLVSITILGIVLLSFMNFFLQSSTYTNANQKKTVGVNVARNVLMFMEKQNFLEIRNYFHDVNTGDKSSEADFLTLLICDEKYKLFSDSSTESEINNTCPKKKNITINGLEYEAAIFSEEVSTPGEMDYYIPITVKVRWNINDREYSTTVDGKIKSEDIR